MDLYDNINIKM